jgi:hypothetical protein
MCLVGSFYEDSALFLKTLLHPPAPSIPLPLHQSLTTGRDSSGIVFCVRSARRLVRFDEGEVEWKALGEVAIIGTGSRNTNESILNGKYPFFVRSQRTRAINEYEFF